MKTRILLLPIILLSALVSTSQISINLAGTTTNVSGTIQPYELTESVSGHSMLHFEIINSSGSPLDLMVTRKIITQTSGWSNYLCFGASPIGTCYPAQSSLIWSTNIESISDKALLDTYVSAPDAGSAHDRYYVSEDAQNFLDSVDIQVNSTADLEDINFTSLQIYPNPASEKINIKNNSPFLYSLKNSIGAIILISEFEVTIAQMNISNLPKGVYFLSLQSNGSEKIEKILVQ